MPQVVTPGRTVPLPDGTTVTIPGDATNEQKLQILQIIDEAWTAPTSRSGGAPSPRSGRAPSPSGQPIYTPSSEGNLLYPFGRPSSAPPPYEGGIGSLRPAPSAPDREEYTGEEGTIRGSLWEGVKNIPRGMQQFALLARQGIAALASPDEDTEKEKELRRKQMALYEEMDPRYRDAHLAQIGMGLGQVGAMIGLGAAGAALAPVTGIASLGMITAGSAAGLMGAGEAATKLADYEERTGEDVSTGKEMAALGIGLGIGLTEMAPLAKYGKKFTPFLAKKGRKEIAETATEIAGKGVLQRAKEAAPNVISSALQQGVEEAAQEAGAGFLQSSSARWLYDDDALADAGHHAIREAIAGGEVGAVADVLMSMAKTFGTSAIRSGPAARVRRALRQKYDDRVKRMSKGELARRDIDKLLTGTDEESQLIRKGLKDGTIMESAAAQYEVKTKKIEEKYKNDKENPKREEELEQLKIESDKVFEDVLFRESAVRMHEEGLLSSEVEVEEGEAEIERITDKLVAKVAAGEEITDDEAGAIGAANVIEVASIAKLPAAEVLDQVLFRLRPTQEEIRRIEMEKLAEDGIEDQRKRRDAAQNLKTTEKNLEELSEWTRKEEAGFDTWEKNTARKLEEVDGDIMVQDEIIADETGGTVAYSPEVYEQLGEQWNALDSAKDDALEAGSEAEVARLEAEIEAIDGTIDLMEARHKLGVRRNSLRAEYGTNGNDGTKRRNIDGGRAEKLGAQLARRQEALKDARKKVAKFEATTKEEIENAVTSSKEGGGNALDFQDRLVHQSQRDALASLVATVEANPDLELTAAELRGVLNDIFTGGLYAQTDIQWTTGEAIAASSGSHSAVYRQTASRPYEETLQTPTYIIKKVPDNAKDSNGNDILVGDEISEGEYGRLRKQVELSERIEGETSAQRDRRIAKVLEGDRTEVERTRMEGVAEEDRKLREQRDRDEKAATQQRIEELQREIDGLDERGEEIPSPLLLELQEEQANLIPVPPTTVTQRPRPVRNNAAMIPTAATVIAEETDASRKTADKIMSAIAGFAAGVQAADAIDSGLGRDRPADIDKNKIEKLPHIRGKEIGDIFKKVQEYYKKGKKLPAKLMEQALKVREITQDLNEFAATSLGMDAADVVWDNLQEGEQQLVFSRILRSKTQKTKGKSYETVSRVPPAAGRMILSHLATKTKGGKYRRMALGKPGNRSKKLQGFTNQINKQFKEQGLDLTVEEVADYLERALSYGVLGQTKGSVYFLTEAQVKDVRTERAKEVDAKSEELGVDQPTAEALVEAKARLDSWKAKVRATLTQQGHTETALKLMVAADSVYASIEGIATDPEVIVQSKVEAQRAVEYGYDRVHASLRNHGTMVLFNISQMEGKPGSTESIDKLIRQYAFHEGAHIWFLRDDLTTSQQESLERYGENEIVPEAVNAKAHKKDQTWRKWVEEIYSDKIGDPALITEETSVRILDALAQDQIPRKKSAGFLGKIKRELKNVGIAIGTAYRSSDLDAVMEIFEKLQSGEILRRREAMAENRPGIETAKLLERATFEQRKQLMEAARNSEAELEKVSGDVIESTLEEAAATSITDAFLNDLRARQEIAETSSTIESVINKEALENGEISVEALNAYFTFRDSTQPEYRFLSENIREFRWGKRNSPLTPDAQDLYQNSIEPSPLFNKPEVPAAEAIITAPEDHNLDKDGGHVKTKEEFEEMIKYRAKEMFRFRFLDRRLPQWLSAKRAKQIQDAAGNLAAASAIAAWRTADNALNFLPGMRKYGPLSYINGGFQLLPRVRKVEDSDGNMIEREVKGLGAIFKPLVAGGEKLQGIAQTYLTAKRLLDHKAKMDTARAEMDAAKADRDAVRTKDPAYKALNKQYYVLKTKFEHWETKYRKLDPKKKLPADEAEALIIRIEEGAQNGNKDYEAVVNFAVEYGDFNYFVLEFAQDVGLITEAQKIEWQSMSYIPFYRDQGQNHDAFMYNRNSKRGSEGTRSKPLITMSVEGSLEDISGDMLGMITRNVQAITRDGMWNIATRRTMRDELAAGTGIDVTGMTNEQIDAVVKETEFSNVVVQTWEDGVHKQYLVADPLLAQSIMSLGISPQTTIENFFGKISSNEKLNKGLAALLVGSSRFLREAVTRSPPFVVKNILRDAWQASVVYGGGPQLALKAIKYALTPGVVERAEKLGLSIGVDYTPNPDSAADQELKMMKREEMGWGNPAAFVGNVWAGMGHMARRSEVATRMAVYDSVLKENNGDAAEAFYQATEIMNYGRRGASPLFSALTAMSPFMNGRIQGLDIVLRTHTGSLEVPSMHTKEYDDSVAGRAKRVATAAARGAFLTLGTLIYFLAVKDDEEYKNAREDLKNDWWLVPLGGDLPGLKIPIPFEIGTLYKVIPEQIMRAIAYEEHDLRDVRDETIRQIRASLSLDLRPQLIRPMIDAMINRDAFQRDQIVPTWMSEDVASTQQRGPYTSQIAILLADSIDKIPLIRNMDFLTSPMKIEYMARQYVGTLGAYAMVVADRVAREVTDENIVGTAADFGFNRDTIDKMPLIGDLLYNPVRGGGFQEDFYEMVEDVNKVVTTLGQIRKTREGKRTEGYVYEKENEAVLAHKRRIDYFGRRMDHWRMERDRLFQRNDLSDEGKRSALHRMFETRDDMLSEMLKIMADVREDRGVMEAILGKRPT